MRRTRPNNRLSTNRLARAALATIFALFLPLGLAGCGGDDDGQGGGVTPAETDEGAPTDEGVGESDDQNDTLGGEAED